MRILWLIAVAFVVGLVFTLVEADYRTVTFINGRTVTLENFLYFLGEHARILILFYIPVWIVHKLDQKARDYYMINDDELILFVRSLTDYKNELTLLWGLNIVDLFDYVIRYNEGWYNYVHFGGIFLILLYAMNKRKWTNILR